MLTLAGIERIPEVASSPPVGSTSPLAGLVQAIGIDGELPLVSTLDPYRLGSTPTNYGDAFNHGTSDPYVARTANDVDTKLRASLQPGRLVVLVGPSKVGKTRTAFEAMAATWGDARRVAPTDAMSLRKLVDRSLLATSGERLVVWLDDLGDYLTSGETLTTGLLTALLHRESTVAIGTIRVEELHRIDTTAAEIGRGAAAVLDLARPLMIEMHSTTADAVEQGNARIAYPAADLSRYGLGEQLTGGPALLRRYRQSQFDEIPAIHVVIRSVIDWMRCGMTRPLPEVDLIEITLAALRTDHPELDVPIAVIDDAVAAARKLNTEAGRIAPLTTVLIRDARSYEAFAYLVAADDGQDGPARAVSDEAWNAALARATPAEANAVGVSAFVRDRRDIALAAFSQVITTYTDDPTPAIRERVANAFASRGHRQAVLGQLEAPRSWELAIERQPTQIDALINLATIAEFEGDRVRAGELLDSASLAGAELSAGYQALLLIDSDGLGEARAAVDEADTDAMNFVGRAARRLGRGDDARALWSRSAELGDVVAPLLLALAAHDNE